jgi:short-subunit dehydrogenase
MLTMTELRDATVLVTGAGGGFGQAMTRQLLAAGSQLMLTDREDVPLQQVTEKMLEQAGASDRSQRILRYIAADLSSADGCRSLYEAAGASAPPVDVLINNAGIAMSGYFVDIPQAEWERLIQINLLAPMRLTALFAPGMIDRRHGHIVNISSVAGLIGVPTLAPYSVAKFGLRGFTEALAREMKPRGVSVTGVYPYFARTPILNSPHYGSSRRASAPERGLYSPDFVVEQMIRGIKRGRVHVCPGFTPRLIEGLRRYAPWLLSRLS